MASPFGNKVQCSKCDSEESLMWHKMEKGVQCNDCLVSAQLALKAQEKEDQKPSLLSVEKSKSSPKKNFRSTRSYKTRQNPNAAPKPAAPKGKGRRQIFKRRLPVKLPTTCATFSTRESIYHNDVIYRLGDIVALTTDERVYYAQINGLIVDQYGEKSATITWLVPNRKLPDWNMYHPMDYRPFYFDDLPRSLNSMTFVEHSLMDYYRNNYPMFCNDLSPEMKNLLWGRLAHLW